MPGKGIKTRQRAEKTIKRMDKSAVVGNRMKRAYAKTKEMIKETNLNDIILLFISDRMGRGNFEKHKKEEEYKMQTIPGEWLSFLREQFPSGSHIQFIRMGNDPKTSLLLAADFFDLSLKDAGLRFDEKLHRFTVLQQPTRETGTPAKKRIHGRGKNDKPKKPER